MTQNPFVLSLSKHSLRQLPFTFGGLRLDKLRANGGLDWND